MLSRRESDGSLTPIAGGGGYIGDGGAASAATLSGPQGVAVDAAHNIYIDDQGELLIRRITADGIISTIAGIGHPGYYGDGGPATLGYLFFPRGVAVDASGNVYIADTVNGAIRQLTPSAPMITGVGSAARFVT